MDDPDGVDDLDDDDDGLDDEPFLQRSPATTGELVCRVRSWHD